MIVWVKFLVETSAVLLMLVCSGQPQSPALLVFYGPRQRGRSHYKPTSVNLGFKIFIV